MVIKLGCVTEKLAEKIFNRRLQQAIAGVLDDEDFKPLGLDPGGASQGKSVTEPPVSRRSSFSAPVRRESLSLREPPKELLANRQEITNTAQRLMASSDSSYQRSVVDEVIVTHEEERAQKILMTISQRLSPMGPLAYLSYVTGCFKWWAIPEWFDTDKPTLGGKCGSPRWCWYNLLGEPCSMLSIRNAWHAFTFQWTGWGVGSPEQQKQQILDEQQNISLIAALVFTVAAQFLLNLMIPSDLGVPNFPSDMGSVNWGMINCFTCASVALLLGTLLSVFLMMAVNEVGTAENAELLQDWLGDWAVLLPILNCLIGIFGLFLGLLMWIYAIFEKDQTSTSDAFYWVVVSGFLLIGGTFTLWYLNLVSTVWRTIARGQESLEAGHAMGRRTQSIAVKELRSELDKCKCSWILSRFVEPGNNLTGAYGCQMSWLPMGPST